MKNKFKTKKALLKRIKITANKKWVRRFAHTSHLSASKTKHQKQRLSGTSLVKRVDYKRLKKVI